LGFCIEICTISFDTEAIKGPLKYPQCEKQTSVLFLRVSNMTSESLAAVAGAIKINTYRIKTIYDVLNLRESSAILSIMTNVLRISQ
jgi:hypothetical protein